MFKEALTALAMFLNGAVGAPTSPPAFAAPAATAPASAAPAVAAAPLVRVARAEPLTADEVVTRVQAFYDKTDRLTAAFRQHYTNVTFGKVEKHDGRVYIKKPGKMRWDYAAKVRGRTTTVKSFISDGQRLWAVEHDNKQVFKKSLEEDLLPVAITFLYGKGDLRRDFDAVLAAASDLGKPGEYVLELTPKMPSAQYKKLWLVVNPDDFRVRRSVVEEASGNTNSFTFYQPDLDKRVADGWFVFNEKAFKGYRVISDKPPSNR
jgi:outer membrane lipoprotein carrier protein